MMWDVWRGRENAMTKNKRIAPFIGVMGVNLHLSAKSAALLSDAVRPPRPPSRGSFSLPRESAAD
jgi:hypothetical protein